MLQESASYNFLIEKNLNSDSYGGEGSSRRDTRKINQWIFPSKITGDVCF